MTEGIAHTPTQEDSHEYIQARRGWSVADMSKDIESKDNLIDVLQNDLKEKDSEIASLKHENFGLDRVASFYAVNALNAYNLLSLVNCPNEDQAKINFAMQILNDVLVSQKARKGEDLDG